MQRSVKPSQAGSTPARRTKIMDTQEKLHLITRNIEEVISEKDLEFFLSKNVKLKHYIGFEISGKIHLGTGLMAMQKVKDLADAGVECTIFLADWHTWINEKLGGAPLDVIKKVAVGYFQEGLSIAYKCLGGNPKDLHFVLGTDLYHNNDAYWQTVIDVSKHITLSRALRSITILGRQEGGDVPFAQLIYPSMQVADIFIQQVHIAHAGLDQRKAHVIARDVAEKVTVSPLKIGDTTVKPIALHHHLLLGLQKPSIWPIPEDGSNQELFESMKMSKSKPDSAIFIHDSKDEIRRKVNKAFCSEKEVVYNPILDWTKSLIFSRESEVTIKREEKYGGNVRFLSYEELEGEYQKGNLFPADLKNFVAEYLITILKPVRDHFVSGDPKEMLDELERLQK